MMIKKFFFYTIILILILQSTLIANANTVIIQNKGDNQYKSIRITPEIYKLANQDLSDILIKDEKGQVVPYFINTSFQKNYKENKKYEMILINSYLKENAFYFDYKLKTIPENDVIATSIVAESSNVNFAKNVEIFGSFDNLNWQKLKDDTLYHIDNNLKMKITFDEPQKYTYYRFKLSNNLEKISFDQVYLEYSATQRDERYFIETIKPKFKVSQNNRDTEIKIKGIKNLKLAEITIVSDSMFKRMLITPFGNKQIYNLSFDNENYQDTSIPMDWQISNTEPMLVTIQNNDDKPIDIQGIIVKYYADDLIFDGSNSNSFTLEFGASKDKIAPNYDISKYQDLALRQKIDSLEIGKITYDKKEEKSYDYQWIFNIVIVVIGALLGFIILSKMKKRS